MCACELAAETGACPAFSLQSAPYCFRGLSFDGSPTRGLLHAHGHMISYTGFYVAASTWIALVALVCKCVPPPMPLDFLLIYAALNGKQVQSQVFLPTYPAFE